MTNQVNEPLVSIIMNCFNGERFLKDAIDSICAQTYKNWEIIFWDNGSTDKSANIARSYDDRIRYYYAPETTVLGAARVKATKKANGKYLAFLDCDDVWSGDKLEKQIQLILEDGSALVYGRSEIIFSSNQASQIFMEGKQLPEGRVFSQLVCENFIPFVSAVVDKEKFDECGGFPSHYKHSTDYWIFLHIAHKFKVSALQDVCCKYRIHEGNLSNFQHVICALEDIEVTKLFLPDPDAIIGLRFKRVNLTIAYFREWQYKKAINNLIEYGGWTILLNKILNKLIKNFK
jgi:glycosyltransferase involved in cell wall biosynthesis